MLALRDIEDRLWGGSSDFDEKRDLLIAPRPEITPADMDNVGLELHLGSWFCTFRESGIDSLSIRADTKEGQIVREHYVPLGKQIVIHPGQFILGITLEWVRFPTSLAAHVVGKSSWGRRGLIIATATGVQPSFNGCLTLELANVGRAPLVLTVGLPICQLMFESVEGDPVGSSRKSSFGCTRKPAVGAPKEDWLSELYRSNL